jgi:hypothetical protein
MPGDEVLLPVSEWSHDWNVDGGFDPERCGVCRERGSGCDVVLSVWGEA